LPRLRRHPGGIRRSLFLIDIEGADRLCLDYLKGLNERPKFLSIEDEKTDFSKLLNDLGMLRNLGYTQFRAVKQWVVGGSVSGRPVREAAHASLRSRSFGVFGPDLSGPWMSLQELIVEYKWIYEMYLIFGDNSPMSREPDLNRLRMQLEHFFPAMSTRLVRYPRFALSLVRSSSYLAGATRRAE
jgi:hypothetical protein